MAQDSGFWTWPMDRAAAQTRSPLLAISAVALYIAGALVLIAQSALHLPGAWYQAGAALLALGVVDSIAILAKVVLTRARLS